MAEVIARVRKELQERLEELEAELANVEALTAERAQIQRALATPPFATPDPPRRARRARPAPSAPVSRRPRSLRTPWRVVTRPLRRTRAEAALAVVDDPVALGDEVAPVALVEEAPAAADDVAPDERVEEDLAA